MRVIHSSFGVVNNTPAGVQDTFSDSHILKYFEAFRETRGLPDLSSDRGVSVREMVILMTELYSIHRHLDDSRTAVHDGEGGTPLQAGFCLRQLPPVNRPDRWFIEIAQKCGEPR